MTSFMYATSVPALKQYLTSLDAILKKAEAHAEAKKIQPSVLLQSRLFPDMFPLIRQVQISCDFAKGTAARLAGVDVPSHEDTEQTFEELHARIAKVLAFVDSLDASKFEGSETREIVLRPGTPREQKLSGLAYLVNYSLPQFYFHVVTAYDILRHNGVEIGKPDFVGKF
jgi:uncharacterized protein